LGSTNVVVLQLVIERRAWLRVRVDGEQVFQGRALPGDVLEFQAEEVAEVTTGNGGGVRVYLGGQNLGLMGELGQVITRLFTREGAITPTPTETGTPTLSPTQTRTPTPSRTPRITTTPDAGGGG
jgi:hypothetical protein